MQEVKWSSVQRNHPGIVDPKALLEAIPDAVPVGGVLLRRLTGVTDQGLDIKGCYEYDDDAMRAIPALDWGHFLQMGTLPAQSQASASGATLPAPATPGPVTRAAGLPATAPATAATSTPGGRPVVLREQEHA